MSRIKGSLRIPKNLIMTKKTKKQLKGNAPGSTDTVPAMLTPGEYVIRKSMVDKYGKKLLDKINNGTYNTTDARHRRKK